jgi:two-component system response regulator DevR
MALLGRDLRNPVARSDGDRQVMQHRHEGDSPHRQGGAGRSLLDNRAAAALMAKLRGAAEKSDPLSGLTDQERTLLSLLSEGLTNKQIADRMFLAEKTVKNYVSRLLAKLGMERRTQAAVFATELKRSRPPGDGP